MPIPTDKLFVILLLAQVELEHSKTLLPDRKKKELRCYYVIGVCTPCSTIIIYIVVVSFIGVGNRSVHRKSLEKLMRNFE